MKNVLFALLLTATAFVSAEPLTIAPEFTLPLQPAPEYALVPISSLKEKFFYVRFAAAERDVTRPGEPLPGLGIGYRQLAGNGAADISINGIGIAERKKSQIFWSAPRASYLRYLQPDAEKSTYVGGGLAWGGVASRGQDFIGLIPSATFGYEFARKSAVLGFAEFNVSQPALAVHKMGPFPGPIAECTVGIGF